jgi:MFS family permease
MAEKTCTIFNLNYKMLSNMSYVDAEKYLQNNQNHSEVSCLANKQFQMHYEQEKAVSMIPEWDLICENTALRSTVQVALSVGKFFGATTFGIISDKYGRKSSFSLAAVTYMVSGMMVTFSPWYLIVLLGRVGIGASSAGILYSTFTLCKNLVSFGRFQFMLTSKFIF